MRTRVSATGGAGLEVVAPPSGVAADGLSARRGRREAVRGGGRDGIGGPAVAAFVHAELESVRAASLRVRLRERLALAERLGHDVTHGVATAARFVE